MKKVIINNNPDTVVTADQVNTDKFYGVKLKDEVGFITQRDYCCGDFIILLTTGTTRCNALSFDSGYFDREYCDLSVAINYIITVRKDSVYEFDTFKELTQWLNQF